MTAASHVVFVLMHPRLYRKGRPHFVDKDKCLTVVSTHPIMCRFIKRTHSSARQAVVTWDGIYQPYLMQKSSYVTKRQALKLLGTAVNKIEDP